MVSVGYIASEMNMISWSARSPVTYPNRENDKLIIAVGCFFVTVSTRAETSAIFMARREPTRFVVSQEWKTLMRGCKGMLLYARMRW